MSIALTERQERFAFELLFNSDPAGAARRAGYPAANAAAQASALLQDPALRERIRIEESSVLAQMQASPMDLIRERIKAAFFRAEKMFDADGKVLALREMEEGTRGVLLVGVDMRKGDPVIRLRPPNREAALTALEKMHLRREQASERYYEKREREEKQARKPAARAAPAPVPDAPPVMNDWERLQQARAPAAGTPPDAATPPGIFSEKHMLFEGSQTDPARPDDRPDADMSKKSQVLSGSLPDKPPILSRFAQAMKKLGEKRASKPQNKEAPEDSYNFRDDPHWMWGGRRKPTPEPEPHPLVIRAMQDAKRREHHDELVGALRRNGKVMIGGREQLHVPGYNPPWQRGRQDQYAVGKGEGIFDHYREGEG